MAIPGPSRGGSFVIGRGRGSHRNGRVITMTEDGCFVIGRGITSRGGPPAIISVGAPEKPSLELRISNYIESSNGNILDITLEYFENERDYQYFMDTVFDASLKSPELLNDFALHLKILTLIKTHGKEIKSAMLTKLQKTYELKRPLMKEPVCLSMTERVTLRNFCDLMSQIYYRYRIDLEEQLRYSIFETPTLDCMKYLLKIKGINELRLLLKIITFNYLALCENQLDELTAFAFDIRTAISTQGQNLSRDQMLWLLCILDCMNNQGLKLPAELTKYYIDNCGAIFMDLTPYTRRLCADLSDDIMNNHADKFDCCLETYSNNTMLNEDSPH